MNTLSGATSRLGLRLFKKKNNHLPLPGGGYFFVLNLRIKITSIEKLIIKDKASYALISVTPFRFRLMITNHHLSGLSLTVLACAGK